MLALTKILHFLKLRTFCDSDEALLLQKSRNPYKIKVQVPEVADRQYTKTFLTSFKEPLKPDSFVPLYSQHNVSAGLTHDDTLTQSPCRQKRDGVARLGPLI